MTGFEPATSGSTIRRSNQLSYTHRKGAQSGHLSKPARMVATVFPRPSRFGLRQAFLSRIPLIEWVHPPSR